HDLDLLVSVLAHESLCCLREVCIESATQTFVSSDQDQQVTLIAAIVEQRMMKIFVGALRELAQNLRHLVCKRARRDNAVLRASELRGRHHLHGLGDLLRVRDRLDAPADVEKIRHRVTLLSYWLRGRCCICSGRSRSEV